MREPSARVVLNLIPVNAGGGQQQALNLLRYLAVQDEATRRSWLILAGRGSAVADWLEAQDRLSYHSFSSRYLHRFVLNGPAVRRVVKAFEPNVLFHFTAAWAHSDVPQVVRSVYSNLYFPEVPFWPRRPRLTYLKKTLIDRFRLRGTLRADGLIFENKAMQSRAQSLFGYPADRTIYVKPSAAPDDGKSREAVSRHDDGVFRVLYLSSWYRNKNIHLLPYVAARLPATRRPVRFVLSLDADHPEVRSLIVDRAAQLGVSDAFEFVGPVAPLDVPDLVRRSDAVILLSQLECFSSNVVEAWTFERPLLISDKEWARSECADAGFYVDRDDPSNIAAGVARLADDPGLRARLMEAGRGRLAAFNTPEAKARQQIEFLERICRAGKRR